MLGLDSKSVVERICSQKEQFTLPNLRQSVTTGTVGFTLISVAMFLGWAIGGRWLTARFGELGFYAVLAVGFVAGGGGVFAPNIIGNNLGRFYALFVSSFFAYAAAWCACWFLLPQLGVGREWIASIFAPLIMTAGFAFAFEATEQFKRCAIAMIAGHTLGYFIGEWLFAWEPLQNRYGMLVWGFTYGAGFGAGISAMLYWCQTETRAKLQALVSNSTNSSNDASEGVISSD